jgi:hypothetical protein
MSETKYSILREQGEFFDAVPLNEEDNETVSNTDNDDEE